MASLVLAVRFLTIVPVPGREAVGSRALGQAAWWFPVVGLALGGALGLADSALAIAVPRLLSAILVVTVWKVATGGLHLDGLADCLDGLAGQDVEHRLEIMRDGCVGVFGAVGLMLSLLIACAALAGISPTARALVLVLAPAVGRLAPLVVGPFFRPAMPGQGLGGAFLGSLPRSAGALYLVTMLPLAWYLLGPVGPAIAGAALAVSCACAAFLARRFGGLTGDVLGAAVELAELAVLVLGASCAHRGLI
jgi:adenosylcobinamide-GDP ribazoletransferase